MKCVMSFMVVFLSFACAHTVHAQTINELAAEKNRMAAINKNDTASGKVILETVEDPHTGNIFAVGYMFKNIVEAGDTLKKDYGNDVFIARYDENGKVIWAIRAGGNLDDVGRSIAVDESGNSYITGYFYGTATFGDTTIKAHGAEDMFLAKCDPNGNFLWAMALGGGGDDSGFDVSTGHGGSCTVTGVISGIAYFGDEEISGNSNEQYVTAKFDQSGKYIHNSAKFISGQ